MHMEGDDLDVEVLPIEEPLAVVTGREDFRVTRRLRQCRSGGSWFK